jgi:hypothetical protein
MLGSIRETARVIMDEYLSNQQILGVKSRKTEPNLAWHQMIEQLHV